MDDNVLRLEQMRRDLIAYLAIPLQERREEDGIILTAEFQVSLIDVVLGLVRRVS